eukprot:10315114-Heterocapsa_arctica.AAC.1
MAMACCWAALAHLRRRVVRFLVGVLKTPDLNQHEALESYVQLGRLPRPPFPPPDEDHHYEWPEDHPEWPRPTSA